MINIENLSKSFRVYKTRFGMLKDLCGLASQPKDFQDVESLSNISIQIPTGKVHGIIGMNGAGKSTLLKILSGVLHPTSGRLSMHGRVAALLELGTGFHGDLTGRENLYLNGAMVGLSRDEVDSRFASILEFSELGHFIDMPVKIYSSGMYVRLAFAFSISVDPEVLIIDEALSVGDAYFQQKCLKKIREFKERGVTILFVSHDLGAVKMLCDEVTLLEKGRNIITAPPVEVLDVYNAMLAKHEGRILREQKDAGAAAFGESFESGTREMQITSTKMFNGEDREVSAFIAGDRIRIVVEAIVNKDGVKNPTCGILIRDRLGYDVFGTNTFYSRLETGSIAKEKKVQFVFEVEMNLGQGDYTLTVAIHQDQSHVEENYHWIERAMIFKVLPASDLTHIGVARLPVKCEIVFPH